MYLRLRASIVVICLMVTSAKMLAQQPVAAAPPAAPTPEPEIDAAPSLAESNFFDIGLRGTAYADGSDEARHQRYRDLRNGITLDAFRFSKDTASRWFTVESDHVGYRDQRYAAALNQFGKVKASFEWNQTPLFYSEDTLSLHTPTSPGVLRIDDAIQTGLQNQTTTLPGVVGQAQPFEMRTKRDVADFKFAYTPSPTLDVDVEVKNTSKTGSQPWAGTFGFSNAVELAVPVDTRTTEFDAALEWTKGRGSARVAYDGSFFNNHVDTLVWDNPLRITDSPSAGPLEGRMSLWPDSTMNAGSLMGTLALPKHSRATAYISVGSWSQDAPLIPYTINSALPEIPLDRPTADVHAVVTAMNYTFTSRPRNDLFFSARYNVYDFDNHTPVFAVANTVAYDTSVSAFAHGGTSALGFTRNTFDAEVSYMPRRFTALRAGYSLENVDQTFRSVDTTSANTLRLSADLTGTSWLTLRGLFEHTQRTGSGFDEQVLDDIGEQVTLRQFDISDRTLNRFSAIVMAIPLPQLSINGSVSVASDDRPQDGFGVLQGDNNAYSIGTDWVPRDAISAGLSYTWEKYSTLQKSRQANPGAQFDDPTRDWTTDAGERADTFVASLDLIKAWPRTDVKFAYTYSHAESLYVYGLAPNTTLPPVSQLPAVVNQLESATLDVRYFLTRHFAAGGAYWFDKYNTNDFAQGAETLNSIAQPSFLMIGYTDRPYTANSIVARLTYIW